VTSRKITFTGDELSFPASWWKTLQLSKSISKQKLILLELNHLIKKKMADLVQLIAYVAMLSVDIVAVRRLLKLLMQSMTRAKSRRTVSLSACIGATENAGVENAIRSKMQGWKMQEWKMRE